MPRRNRPLDKKRLSDARALWAAANTRVEEILGRESAVALRSLADEVASGEFLAAYSNGE
jgi:hypothetical protein